MSAVDYLESNEAAVRARMVNVTKVGAHIRRRRIGQTGGYTAEQRVFAACRTPADIDEVVVRAGVTPAVARRELLLLVGENRVASSVVDDVVFYEVRN